MIIRVLLADDHPATCAGLRAMLDAVPDIEVVGEAHDGLEVQRLIAELHPAVLLLDLVMPDLRPAEFVLWTRANYPGTEVLPLTAHDRDYYLAWMVESGAAGFVTKDEAAENLVEAIRRAVRGEVLFSREQLARVEHWREAVGQKWERLTKREQEVLRLTAQGLDNATIAGALGVRIRTVEQHITNILDKLGASSRLEAAMWVRDHLPEGLWKSTVPK